MPGTQPLDLLSVCMYGLLDTSLRHKVSHVARNALAMYTMHGLSACISKLCKGRESTQRESRKMESLSFLAVMLSTILSGTVGNL